MKFALIGQYSQNQEMKNRTSYLRMLVITMLCVTPFFLVGDDRYGKEVLVLLMSGAIIFLSCIKNPITGLVAYLFISPFFAPPFELSALNQNVAGFWQYKPLAFCLIFYFLFSKLSSIPWPNRILDRILKVMDWSAFITAIYLVAQYFNLDQFLVTATDMHTIHSTNPHMTATLTNSTLASAFLTMCLPALIYRRAWIRLAFVCVMMYSCQSLMAIGAGIVSILVYRLIKINKMIAWVCFGLLLICVLIYAEMNKTWVLYQSNGRIQEWGRIIKEVVSPSMDLRTRALTGYGLGAYSYIYVSQHTVRWCPICKRWEIGMWRAHNEFIEFFYNAGIIGLGLLIFSIISLIYKSIPFIILDERMLALLSSFLALCLLACGTFIWQVEPFRIYTVVIVSILTQKINQGVTA
ncbi:MAG: hypothetical protein A4E53_01682 [Pelotomaculum sp. PtaB.Bin104]|nr:MAG: hypothetical protein A4E53_01682 [Pelotomaculum sp. PtaB.Bin104]